MFTDGSEVFRGWTCGSRALYGFLKQPENVINLLERKVEKLKHMKLEVMQSKIKKTLNVNKQYGINPHEVFQSGLIQLIQSIIY